MELSKLNRDNVIQATLEGVTKQFEVDEAKIVEKK